MKKQRTAKQSIQFAIQEAIEIGEILKKFQEISLNYHEEKISLIQKHKAPIREVIIKISGHELSLILGALRDYTTLRIANIFDEHPATRSLKDLELINLSMAREIPQIKEILKARDNWIGHINKRYIGPVAIEKLYSKEITRLLSELQFFTLWTKEKKEH